MTSRCLSTLTLFAALLAPGRLSAQHTRYKFIDIPTLGGPAAYGQVDGPGLTQFINNAGIVVGGADTTIADPNPSNCVNPDCFFHHAFRWQNGLLTDLGALPGVNWSHAAAINARGWAAGGSSITDMDPLTGSQAEHAVLWKGSEIVDLGTLGTGLESAALSINNGGQVVGFSTFDTTPDPTSFKGASLHAFLWDKGVMQDLGTLGGPDSSPAGGCNNQRMSLVAGTSFTSSTPNPTTGIPTQHAFLWDKGTMGDIPTLGGTFAYAQCANNQGQMIGQSSLTGDVGCDPSDPFDTCDEHPFLWEHGTVRDLGTLGGSFALALWLNNNGEAVGGANTSGDEQFQAARWKNGVITGLKVLDDDCASLAYAVNSRGQAVGQSFNCDTNTLRVVLWENNSVINLNEAIPPNSSLDLLDVYNINDRGEIVGRGLPPGCDDLDKCGHVFLLIPCDNAVTQGCDSKSDLSARTGSSAIAKKAVTSTERREMTRKFVAQLRARLQRNVNLSGSRRAGEK
jgi:probable HAF family extracellular repeat protein